MAMFILRPAYSSDRSGGQTEYKTEEPKRIDSQSNGQCFKGGGWPSGRSVDIRSRDGIAFGLEGNLRQEKDSRVWRQIFV